MRVYRCIPLGCVLLGLNLLSISPVQSFQQHRAMENFMVYGRSNAVANHSSLIVRLTPLDREGASSGFELGNLFCGILNQHLPMLFNWRHSLILRFARYYRNTQSAFARKHYLSMPFSMSEVHHGQSIHGHFKVYNLAAEKQVTF